MRDWADYPHIRIYASIFSDDKFDKVREDDAALSWYVRLLFAANGSYPAPAFLPKLPRKVLATLQDAGLITVAGSTFTMKGLVKERSEVADLGHRAGGMVRAATAERDGSGRFQSASALDAAGPATVDQHRTDVRTASTSTSRTSSSPYDAPDDLREDVEAFLQVRRRMPTPGQQRVLDDVLGRRDVTGPKWAAEIILANPQDPIGAVIEADRQWRSQRKSQAIAEEKASEGKRQRGIRDPLLQEIAAAYAAAAEPSPS